MFLLDDPACPFDFILRVQARAENESERHKIIKFRIHDDCTVGRNISSCDRGLGCNAQSGIDSSATFTLPQPFCNHRSQVRCHHHGPPGE